MPSFAHLPDVAGVDLTDEAHLHPGLHFKLVSREPFVAQVTFPPNGRAERHRHHFDTVYTVQQGTFVVDEVALGVGDVFWVRAGEWYGPEGAGPEGARVLIVSVGGPLGTDWFDEA
jgi:mannose-6-phosphate isomerase-like protein (cupin superfamily)